jgi:cytochrome c oxidase cbb3-type subunit 3
MKTVQSNARLNSSWLLLPAMFLTTLSAVAQQAAPEAAAATPAESPSLMMNPTFIILLVTTLVLLGVILSLAGAIRNLSESGRAKLRKDKISSLSPILALAFLLPLSSSAQEVAAVAAIGPTTDKWMPPIQIAGLDSWIFVLMLVMIIVEFIIILGLLKSIKQLLIGFGFQPAPDMENVKPWINWKWLDRQLTDAVPLEQEATVMTDHEYDGIRELDNNLPPWWKYGFYFTIVFGIVYMFNYHISHSSPLQSQEYQKEMADAELMKKEHLKEVGSNVDETNVTILTDAASMASAKEIFTGNCAACHGQNGEGGVGPNLTDPNWINGGGIQNVFKTIKYGVPAKGMIAWQAQLKPEAMQKLASYILTLQGTNPANAKAPQGEVWVEPTATPSDTSTAKTDTTKAMAATEVK